ncbi:MAG TPA: lamin tail domain-containing protein [Pyrinomonadaceae bacterium]|jgi:hypothetical protein
MLLCPAFVATTPRVAAQSRIGGAKTQSNLSTRLTGRTEVAAAPATAGQLIISEFRLNGPQGSNDEFIEIYNNSDTPHVVTTVDGSTGYGVVSASNTTLNDATPTLRCTIPNNTNIPARGHFLCTNIALNGYSLATYPSGNSTFATGDAIYLTDIPDNDGLALFNTNLVANFTIANRLDAVGSNAVTNSLYREGTGYNAITPFPLEYSFLRKLPGGCHGYNGNDNDDCNTNTAAANTPAPSSSYPQDTDNNFSDFIYVNTNGTASGGGQARLGAPGPENLSSPVANDLRAISNTNLDPSVANSDTPNRVRDMTSDASQNSTFGTIDIRRTFTNNTGVAITRLRFRIVDITTFPTPGQFCNGGGTATNCIADLRARSSSDIVVSTSEGNKTVRGTTLEATMPGGTSNQPGGGGWNSSLSAGNVTFAQPLNPGASVDVRFLLGVQKSGKFRFFVNIEALP